METDADHRYANTASETDVSEQVCMVYEAHERTNLLAAQTAQGQSRGSLRGAESWRRPLRGTTFQPCPRHDPEGATCYLSVLSFLFQVDTHGGFAAFPMEQVLWSVATSAGRSWFLISSEKYHRT